MEKLYTWRDRHYPLKIQSNQLEILGSIWKPFRTQLIRQQRYKQQQKLDEEEKNGELTLREKLFSNKRFSSIKTEWLRSKKAR